MQPVSAVVGTAKWSTAPPSTITFLAALVSLVWVVIVVLACSVGHIQIRRHYSRPPAPARLSVEDAPHVTVIRPLKGLEPRLYDCLACTFRQHYPQQKLHIRFCVSDPNDLSIPIVQQLLEDFPAFDAQLLVEAEDELLQSGAVILGPNPKIRNMSRAYREAVGDIIWAMDCNVWVANGALARMVNKLEGRGEKYRWKLVHHLPIVQDIRDGTTADEKGGALRRAGEKGRASRSAGEDTGVQIQTSNAVGAAVPRHSADRSLFSFGGGRMEEQYLSSMHPKFYVAAHMLRVPAVVGKSVMYRRSHLDSLTGTAGIHYFSDSICEDQLMGVLMFKNKVPEEIEGEKMGRQAICWGDIAIQPMANMSVSEFWQRRVRWFRVRKFTEFLPSLVESGTESMFCSIHLAFTATTLPFLRNSFGIPPTWTAFTMIWLLSVCLWCFMDWSLYQTLHSAATTEVGPDTPSFARPARRPFKEWLLQWLGRETLAFPIWMWAFYGGTKVKWRGQEFRVGMDSKVHAIPSIRKIGAGKIRKS